MAWKGIVGKSFTPDGFADYVAGLKFGAWRPHFVVVHNTSAPDTKTWQGWQARKPPITDEKWMQNLVGYYRDEEGWSSGPHLFVTPGAINVFSPLTGPGTHSPSWNAISWGIETVGEFETDAFAGPVRDNLIAAIGILHMAAGLSVLPYSVGVRGLHFHKEDVRTTHRSCPGRHMDKAQLVHDVQTYIDGKLGGDHTPVPPKAQGSVGTVNTPDLNVRAGSGSKTAVVAALAKGAAVSILGEAMNGPDKWLQITSGKTSGWVAARFVTI